MSSLLSRLSLILMIGCALWVAGVAGLVEAQNARAGFYLPRRDRHDGKWRISGQDTPRDQLRGLVGGVGLLQYIFCPLVIVFAACHATISSSRLVRHTSVAAGAVGLIAGMLVIYRDYFGSLGT